MTTVLAAVDTDNVRHPVLEAAVVVAGVYGADVEAVHIAGPGARIPIVDDVIDVPLRLLERNGNVADTLVAAIEADDVVAAVIGTRTATKTGAPPGHVAIDVATRVDKPVVLVPPDSPPLVPGQRIKALVPLDGSELSALTVRAVVRRVANADVEIIVLHVFGPTTAPQFLDHPEHDLPAWADEFRMRYCDEPGSRVEWRQGETGTAIAETARAEKVNAVILGWGQDLGEGHAEPVRAALSSAGVPVILVPRTEIERTLATVPERPRRRNGWR
jgi:hypothetical protein